MTKTSNRPDKSGTFVDDISLSQGTCIESDWFGGPEPPVVTLPTQPGPKEPTKPVATVPPSGPEVEGYEMEVGVCLEYVHSSGHASVETCAKWCNPDPNCKSFTFSFHVSRLSVVVMTSWLEKTIAAIEGVLLLSLFLSAMFRKE